MPIVTAVKMLLGRLERFFVYRVLSLDDTPHRIALGVALGIFVAWTPSIPLQMASVLALAWLLKANKFVGLPFVWISNPLTIVPIYGPNLLLGQWLLNKPVGNFNALYEATHFNGGLIETTQTWWSAIFPILVELWVGSLIVATILGVLTYFAMYRIIILWRRTWHRHYANRYAHADAGQADPADHSDSSDQSQKTDGKTDADDADPATADQPELMNKG